jgi:hypothetical protein
MVSTKNVEFSVKGDTLTITMDLTESSVAGPQ